MAIIEKIRTRAGVLVAIVIGISLLAFILGDFLESGRLLFSGSRYEIARIAGKSISYQDYQQKVDEVTEIYKNNSGGSSPDEAALESIREQAWRELIQDYVVNEEIDRLGLTVSSDELFDMIQGNNPHPIIRQLFTNPQTGEFNKSQLFQFLKAMDENQLDEKQKDYWLYIENQIRRERLVSKYVALISNGLDVTNYQARQEEKNVTHKANIAYIVRHFTEIPDSAVQVAVSDLKKYYADHKKEYKQEASRSLEYVTFDVRYSQDDYNVAEKWINSIVEDFRSSKDVGAFVNANSDEPYTDKYLSLNEVPDTLKNLAEKGKVGDIFGPYFQDETFKIARLAEIGFVPDSVHARHILIRPQGQDENAMKRALAVCDSLKKLVEKGKDFAELAKANSVDGSASKGGDLGWFREGTMVKPFNDACFSGKKGELIVVETNFGAHLIQILDKSKDEKKVKIAILVRKVQPSDKTYQAVYAQANQFAGNNTTAAKFDKAVADQGLVVKYASNLRPNDTRITGLESPRELIRWAFDAKVGEVSKPFELGDRFVIAKLTQAAEEGIAPFDAVKTQIDLVVRRDKKAEKMIAQINAGGEPKSLEDLATKFNTTVQEASNITFSASTVQGMGFEPKVIAVATTSEVNKLSAPVNGNNGVYVLKVTSVTDDPETKELLVSIKNRLSGSYMMRANYEAIQALQDMANIKDKRSKFY